jgi:succinoglycan biosynthesis transport protein ExoP
MATTPHVRGVHDSLDVLARRFWWAVPTLFGCWAIAWVAGWMTQVKYRSEAVILVEQQKVPENYVMPNVSSNLQDRIQSMTQQILSRTRLQSTIDRFRLYAMPRHGRLFNRREDPVDEMRDDIAIKLVQSPGRRGDLSSFKIEYSAESPELAQRVNSELTSLFIEENLRSQQQLSEGTTAFLNNQLADARLKLAEQESKMQAFKANHFGDLPTQLQSNVQILSGLQAQLQTSQHQLDGARQQELYLESLLERNHHSGVEASVASPESLRKEIIDLRLRLANARSQYTEDHPDVIALKEKLAKTEKLAKQSEAEIASNRIIKNETATHDSEAENSQYDSSTSQIQSQLKANQLEIKNHQRQQQDIESQISVYQKRLNLTPRTEQELADISRGYEEAMSNYNSLLHKQMQSQLATNLEARQQGEQFRILDPPSLPTRPSSSNHFKISLIGLVLGTVTAIGIVALLERTDVRVRSENDLAGVVPVRVLVNIPALRTLRESRRLKFSQWIRIAVALQVVALILVGNVYAFFRG